MALRKKAAAAPSLPVLKPVSEPDPLEKLIDELGDLEKELAPLQPKISRAEFLRKTIRGNFSSEDAARSFEAAGERFIVMVGAKGLQRIVDSAKLAKLIGPAMFAKIASVTLAAVEFGVPAKIAAEVISTTQTGPRTLKLFERGKKAA